MFVSVKTLQIVFIVFFAFLVGLVFAVHSINSNYGPEASALLKRESLLKAIPVASPALVPAGRNVAFESGNSVTNAPASYLTMLDCCESDEAIADRIATGQLRARMIKKAAKGAETR